MTLPDAHVHEAVAAVRACLNRIRADLDEAQIRLDNLVSRPKAGPSKPAHRAPSSHRHPAVRGTRDFGEPLCPHPLNR